ncbi:MAG: hypothetical protein HY22_01710 [[Candidatus Thermochlorobacteriaceae] bacterium GBChlB]|nr:MAG: hypothetical protein HY22_01710 [[Candidatus Thermochlorobacteriaceae] bacterium GBChlB]
MSKTLVFSAVVLTAALLLQSCGVLRQVQEAQNFARCQFRLKTVDRIRVADIDVQNVKSKSDLNLLDAGKLGLALAGNSLPLTLRLNVEAQNPNSSAAAMNRLEWTMFIDDIQMVTGAVSDRIEIPQNSSALVPLDISVDLLKVLSGKSAETIANFAFNLAGEGGKPTRFMLRIKPTITILGSDYSQSFDVRTEFTSGRSILQ